MAFQNIGHGIAAFGVATSALISSLALVPASGLTMAAGAALGALGTGLLSDFTKDMLGKVSGDVTARLRESAQKHSLPVNHDFARAIRRSQLDALSFLVNDLKQAAERDPNEFDLIAIQAFARKADQWIEEQSRAAARPGFMSDWSMDEATAEIDRLINGPSVGSVRDTMSELSELASNAVLDELRSVANVPSVFDTWFSGRSGRVPGWAVSAQSFFVERVKTDQRVRTAVFLDLIGKLAVKTQEIEVKIDSALNQLLGASVFMKERFDRMESLLETMQSKLVGNDPQILVELFINALTQTDFDTFLKRRHALEYAGDHWVASRAKTDVDQRIYDVSKVYYGRQADVQKLDAQIEAHDKSILIVAGPAGAGKSALLANWMLHRQKLGDLVVRHFASQNLASTNRPEDALRHILEQFRRLNIHDERAAIATHQRDLLDQLVAALSIPAPLGERIILILDGLDELNSPLEDIFVRSNLGQGVHVVVSGRAAKEETPRYLAPWQDPELANVPRNRIDVSGLEAHDILFWLEDSLGQLSEHDMLAVSERLYKVTDGLPLFLRYIIEDLQETPASSASKEILIDRLKNLPAPFSGYLAAQLDLMQRCLASDWPSLQQLLGLLSVTLGPINNDDIAGIFEFEKARKPSAPDCPVLPALDHRVTRWLSARQECGKNWYSFSHPRLATEFATAFGDIAALSEELLIDWMESSWSSKTNRFAVRPGSAYALDWLPQHLLKLKSEKETILAEKYLSSPSYLLEQLASTENSSRRLRKSIDTWSNLPYFTQQGTKSAASWSSFWAKNEPSLLNAVEWNAERNLETATVVQGCLGDRQVCGSDSCSPPSRAIVSSIDSGHPITRSINAHNRLVRGVLGIGEQLVSWGSDGAVLFWSKAGERTGGDANAHKDPVNGVLDIGDRLVSWGEDGAVLFWTKAGERLGGNQNTHNGSAKGVLDIGDRLVSWGDDGAILFWSKAGEQTGGDQNAHNGMVKGVQDIGNRLVSWGSDGAILFWSKAGEQTGGDKFAHNGPINGVLDIGDKLVSWGSDGAVLFWSNTGERMGGDQNAHKGGSLGVLDIGDRLVSWGIDGAVLFWSKTGERTGGDQNAHNGWIFGVLDIGDRLVSWGHDGALVFWSKTGVKTGSHIAHKGWVARVLDIGDQLVSRGSDGAILFWSKTGEIMGGDQNAHNGPVSGVLVTGDRLVSWGHDGALVFWSKAGEQTGRIHAHKESVEGVLDIGDRLVSWGGDGAILFWSKAGEQSGGDQNAHSGWILDILDIGDRLVSWSSGGAIMFWSKAGEVMGGVQNAHNGCINGVLDIADRLVSWGNDGAVLFWSKTGERMGGNQNAHKGGVLCVLDIGDRMVSWGNDGAVLFWSKTGELTGGDQNAHNGRIIGVLDIGDRMVSWGSDGGVLFWSKTGERMGGNQHAHKGRAAKGVLDIGDQLVSWGSDGALLFWSKSGEQTVGDQNARDAFVVGVLDIGDRLVSWGSGGAIIFWSKTGERTGGDQKAHNSWIFGVLDIGDRLVSWGNDGAVLFWSKTGERTGGDQYAHKGAVLCVLDIGDRLVSWGTDGAVLFWSKTGERTGGDQNAHKGFVNAVLDIGDRLVSWGDDGAVRFWSRAGSYLSTIVPPDGISAAKIFDRHLVVGRETLWFYDIDTILVEKT